MWETSRWTCSTGLAHIDQRLVLEVGEDGSEPSELDFVDAQPGRCFAPKIFLQLGYIGVEDAANGLLVDADLLGQFGVGVFQRLPPNSAHQALCHLVVLIDLRDDGHEGLPADQANQTG